MAHNNIDQHLASNISELSKKIRHEITDFSINDEEILNIRSKISGFQTELSSIYNAYPHSKTKIRSSYLNKLLLFFLLLFIGAIFQYTRTIISEESYKLANEKNICGRHPSQQIDAFNYMQLLSAREKCLSTVRVSPLNFQEIYSILNSAFQRHNR